MGLRERKRIAELQDDTFPAFAQQIVAALDSDVQITADFQYVQDDVRMIDRVEMYGIKPLTDALKQTAEDALGKAALRQAVQRIELVFEPDFSGDVPNNVAYVISIDQGTLKLHAATSGRGLGVVSYYKDAIEQLLRLHVEREAARIQHETLPQQAHRLTEAFGKALRVEVRWETTTMIEREDDMRALRRGIQDAVVPALLQLASDDFAREAAAEALDGVVFLHQPRDQAKKLVINGRMLEVYAHWRASGTWEECYTNVAYTREAMENVL